MDADNESALALELEALRAIYGSESIRFKSLDTQDKRGVLSVTIYPDVGVTPDSSLYVYADFTLASEFPKTPPLCQIRMTGSRRLSCHAFTELQSIANETIKNLFEPGASSSLFEVVERLRGHVGALEESANGEGFPELPSALPADNLIQADKKVETVVNSSTRWKLYSGEAITDRKSVFQAHIAAVCSRDEVAEVMAELLSSPKVARATHNIMAYRIQSSSFATAYSHEQEVFEAFRSVEGVKHTRCKEADRQKKKSKPLPMARGKHKADLSVLQDHDSDGEKAAGGRLQHLLEILNVINVVVVVSRWYGGIPLGPQRFKHINNVARDLIVQTGIGLPNGVVS